MMHKGDLLELLGKTLVSKDAQPLRNHIADYITYLAFPPGGDPNTFSAMNAYNELDTLIKQLDDVRFMLERVARPFTFEVNYDGYYRTVVYSREIITGALLKATESEQFASFEKARAWGDLEVIKRMEELEEMKMKGEKS